MFATASGPRTGVRRGRPSAAPGASGEPATLDPAARRINRARLESAGVAFRLGRTLIASGQAADGSIPDAWQAAGIDARSAGGDA
jgi:hypothetical protein